MYSLPDLSKAVYVAEGLCFVPPVLSADYATRRSAARETLTEIMVADLGDEISTSPYLIVSLKCYPHDTMLTASSCALLMMT
jgi:cleavage and polyadenylation specificity factor subunit 1